MMFHYPFYNSPFFNRFSRYNYGYRYPPNEKKYNNNSTYDNQNVENNKNFTYKDSQKYNANFNKENSSSKNTTNNSDSNDTPLFQLFGINLYFDDVLIICLILFLLEEGVDDEWLFTALVMLFFS